MDVAPQSQSNTDEGQLLLEVKDLRTYFFSRAGEVKAVDGVSFEVHRGEVLGIVGESGSGKSVTSLSIMGLVDKPGRVVSGSIRFAGEELVGKRNSEMTRIRGDKIAMIFQQPTSSLNPVYRAGFQVSEVLKVHQDLGKKSGLARTLELFRMVGINDPERRMQAYPHEMSGGMAQRIMIAMGLAALPELLIADEPTTALDVTIQAQILDLMRDLRDKLNVAIILITHDMGVVAEMADRVAVMYAGVVVEEAGTEELFEAQKHPYTQGLIGSIPVLGEVKEWLDVIPGTVPNLIDLPKGCRFAPRCKARIELGLTRCTEEEPELVEVQPGHKVRCYVHHDIAVTHHD